MFFVLPGRYMGVGWSELLVAKTPGTHCTGGWVGPRAGPDGWGNVSLTGIQSPDRPTRSESVISFMCG